MNNFLSFYQHLPSYISPNITLGPISVSWYSIMYLAGFFTVYILLKGRIKKGEFNFKEIKLPKNFLIDLLLYIFIGLLIGARLGYVVFYNFSHYWNHPLAIISPFDLNSGEFIGIYGMSYHGGLVGVLMAALIFCQKNKISFWQLAELVVPAVPAGYFWGRLGNFINGELYGRVTEKSWGMYFEMNRSLRHPTQLYEAFFEGIVLFILLWNIRNKEYFRGKLLFVYLIGYAFFRFILEFWREPDSQLGFIFSHFTMGQLLSGLMIMLALITFWRKERNLV